MRELLVGKKEKILAFVNDNVQLINDFAEVVPQLWDEYIMKDIQDPKSKNPFKADGGFYSVPKEDKRRLSRFLDRLRLTLCGAQMEAC